MNRVSVNSSNISSVGYDNNTLEIAFHTGGVYQYYYVPESVYSGLIYASSKGRYFHTHIKNRYESSKVG